MVGHDKALSSLQLMGLGVMGVGFLMSPLSLTTAAIGAAIYLVSTFARSADHRIAKDEADFLANREVGQNTVLGSAPGALVPFLKL